ncbi:class F sortase [Prauserella halophila]|uniref:Class F sortase n=1 Tax=Prauserella halophila TaxID=185641 RepID=A0ABP4GV49_9PSEU|nr:class F sortase [Prauserella halophila]MCP2236215.1 Sortase (surface protein transpeptidase) [Prauserella halophila]
MHVWRGTRGGRFTVSPLLALVLAVAGCAAPDHPAGGGTGSPAPTSTSVQGDRGAPENPAEPVPEWVDVPTIGAHSSLIPLGLNEDGTVAVPSVQRPMQAGWYRHGPVPGEVGPAVVLGHVNGDGRDGIFARLHELGRGDDIRVGRDDGTVVRFRVTRVSQVPKERFPSDRVYGDTADPELRLITCGGEYDEDAESYRDNVIVYAERPPARGH